MYLLNNQCQDHDYRQVGRDAWTALIFQGLAVSVFCFMSWQYLLAKHNSTNLSVFFFVSPLIGMVVGIVLLNETLDIPLLIGCLLVGCGIYMVNRVRS